MANEQFLKERQQIRDMLAKSDPDSKMVSTVPITESIFVKQGPTYYQIVGINSSFVKEQYIEIFVAVDLNETLRHFDETAVKRYYFNLDTIQKTVEMPVDDVKKNWNRTEWRRLQKYLKKEVKNIVKETEYSMDLGT